jgi:hypothetical protein
MTTANDAAPEEKQTPQREETSDAQQDTSVEPQASGPVMRDEFQQSMTEVMNQLKRVQGITTKGLDTHMNKLRQGLRTELNETLASNLQQMQSQQVQQQFDKDLAALDDEEARQLMEKYRPRSQQSQQRQEGTGAARSQMHRYVSEFSRRSGLSIDPDSSEIDYSILEGKNPGVDEWAEFNKHLIELGKSSTSASQEQSEQSEQQTQPQQTKSPPPQSGPDRSQSISSVDQLWDAYTENRIDLDAFKEKHKAMTGRDP